MLPCFLKMISKMNVSPLDGEGLRNLNLLERVLQSFSPVVVEEVKQLSGTFSNWYDNNFDDLADSKIRTPFKGYRTANAKSFGTEFEGVPISHLVLIKEQVFCVQFLYLDIFQKDHFLARKVIS